MLRRFVYLAVILILFPSCGKIRDSKHNDEQSLKNLPVPAMSNFDNDVKKIYDALNSRDKSVLYNFLDSRDSLVREKALYAIASLRDSGNVYKLVQYLNDTSVNVRKAAAYTLGVIGDPNAQDFLIKRYYNESNPHVRSGILEAIGRCGTSRGLYFLSKLNFSYKDSTEMVGLAYGLVRFSMRGKVSDNSTAQALKLLNCHECPQSAKRIVSFYFLSKSVDLSHIYSKLLEAYNASNDKHLKANVLQAAARVQKPEIARLLRSVLKSDDQFLRISAMKAYRTYYGTEKNLVRYLNDPNAFVARLAAEYFIYHGDGEQAGNYFETAKLVRNWQARGIMFHAALKYAPDSLRSIITRSIITGYKATENRYEKAMLLSALSYDPAQYAFVKDQTFYSGDRVISTAGIKTLMKMRLNPQFDGFAQKAKENQQDDLYEEFGLIFKEAMRRGDNAMIYYSTKVFANKHLHLIDKYDNTYFIKQALTKLQLPRDIKVYNSVCRLLFSYTGEKCKSQTIKLSEISWETLERTKSNQQVLVKTSKGDFVIKLYSQQAPAATSAFVKLILENYYDNTFIYRVVPNKMVMASSRRGDGWPDENIVNNVNLSPVHFQEGTLAMQLVDNNTESVQWLITLAPMPQMDGKYTAVGKVVKGMDVIHSLDVSDQIFSIELL